MTRDRLPPLPLRLLAGAGVLLVLALSVLAASPAAPAWAPARADACAAHAHPPSSQNTDDDSGCAVVLFASGLDVPAEPGALLPPASVIGGVLPVTAAELLLSRPRYLRLPERGPPGPV
ncbi:MAG: hypothetical protein ACKOE8_04945 [Opitutaceae bacterium]